MRGPAGLVVDEGRRPGIPAGRCRHREAAVLGQAGARGAARPAARRKGRVLHVGGVGPGSGRPKAGAGEGRRAGVHSRACAGGKPGAMRSIAAAIALVLALGVSALHAFLGVADTSFVTVIANPAEAANWASELDRLNSQLAAARSTLEVAGDIRTYAG